MNFSRDAEAIISKVEYKLSEIVQKNRKRFFAIKLLEKDDKIKDQMKATVDVSAEIKNGENLMMIQKVLSQMSRYVYFLNYRRLYYKIKSKRRADNIR